MFDTSLLHEAANEAESVRYILMLRVWHPGLSPQEVTLVPLDQSRVCILISRACASLLWSHLCPCLVVALVPLHHLCPCITCAPASELFRHSLVALLL